MDTLYRNYEILSEFYQKYFVDLRILDLTCDPVSVPAPTVNNGRVAKYTEVDSAKSVTYNFINFLSIKKQLWQYPGPGWFYPTLGR